MRLSHFPHKIRILVTGFILLSVSLVPSGCFLNKSVEPYYGKVAVPSGQNFRWIDGSLPQTFDPAFAAAPPDTDLVRAIFEGLTDYDPRTLAPVPAVATRWETTNDGRTWTFYLREDAKWSNGEAVVAKDFVDSWRRTMRIGDLAPHTDLLNNIAGATAVSVREPAASDKNKPSSGERAPTESRFGAEAVNKHVLRVQLQTPDMNFPALVAHPVFRPIKVAADNSLQRIGASDLVSNGAFALAKQDANRVLLERAEHYWARDEVSLEHVEFLGAQDAEAALAAYRAGDVDAVTNSTFEPLALKLLAPYQDFRSETYGALTYYSFNLSHGPFDDVRVREALTISIDRERLSQGEMGGATEPAKKFLPEIKAEPVKAVVEKTELLEVDARRARTLLAEAGFPEGQGFPKLRLLINRNEQQRLLAQSIASMWFSVLNIETEIVVKAWDEYEAAVRAGEYDVVRRGLVMQTTDELTNIRAIFQQDTPAHASRQVGPAVVNNNQKQLSPEERKTNGALIETEAEALKELHAIPLYFASSHSLVKPYVTGFDSNLLDLPSLNRVRIVIYWKQQQRQP
jgi:ABC-type oligopeptide transport system substrate-binding subunit